MHALAEATLASPSSLMRIIMTGQLKERLVCTTPAACGRGELGSLQ